jgi:hypothetical protein
MTIKVVLPEGKGPKSSWGTKVFTESGHEIKGVTRINIEMLPDCIVQAQFTVEVSNLENFEGIEGAYRVENFPAKKVCSGIDRIMKRIRRGNHEHN